MSDADYRACPDCGRPFHRLAAQGYCGRCGSYLCIECIEFHKIAEENNWAHPGVLSAYAFGPSMLRDAYSGWMEGRLASRESDMTESAKKDGPYWIVGSQFGIYHTYPDCEGITIAAMFFRSYPTDRQICPACKERDKVASTG